MAPTSVIASGSTTRTETAERRLWERRACSRPIPRRLGLPDGSDLPDGWVLDVSQGGIALLLTQSLAPGTILEAELESAHVTHPVVRQVRVVRAQQMPEGDWVVAGLFVEQLSEEQLRGLLL